MPFEQDRAGRYEIQPGGYRAFLPKDLPPDPELQLSPEMQVLLSEADQALGRLDASASLLPNPDIFANMYLRREAVDSSQIEGTQASLADLLEYESRPQLAFGDVVEVFNYVRAMRHGLERLSELPLSLRLIREIHGELLDGVRGNTTNPGEFRAIQNWIGPAGAPIENALFVPPPPDELDSALAALENYIHDDSPVPLLIRCGLVHAQFETIHPFLDGNGRMGRLLITFMLCWKGVLRRPLLYISDYFKRHRSEYYEHLQAVRDDGDWESWMRFFLSAVREVAGQSSKLSRLVLKMRENHQELVRSKVRGTTSGLNLLESLYQYPVIDANAVSERLSCSYPTANNLIAKFEELGLLNEITGRARNRRFLYKPYLDLFGS